MGRENESRERVSKHYDMKILTVLSVVKAWVRLFCSSNTTTQKLTHTHTFVIPACCHEKCMVSETFMSRHEDIIREFYWE